MLDAAPIVAGLAYHAGLSLIVSGPIVVGL